MVGGVNIPGFFCFPAGCGRLPRGASDGGRDNDHQPSPGPLSVRLPPHAHHLPPQRVLRRPCPPAAGALHTTAQPGTGIHVHVYILQHVLYRCTCTCIIIQRLKRFRHSVRHVCVCFSGGGGAGWESVPSAPDGPAGVWQTGDEGHGGEGGGGRWSSGSFLPGRVVCGRERNLPSSQVHTVLSIRQT